MHPLAKVTCSAMVMMVAIYIREPLGVAAYFLFFLSVVVLGGAGRPAAKLLLFFAPLALLIGAINNITLGGPLSGTTSAVRILFIPLVIVMFAFTTTPSEFIRSLETVRFPRKATLGLLVSIRFIPYLLEDMGKVLGAARMKSRRGIRFYYRAMFVPLVHRLLIITDTIVLALHVRAFSLTEKRTLLRPFPFRARDGLFIACFAIASLIMVMFPWLSLTSVA